MVKNILLVENDSVLAVLTRLELEELGYSVDIASEGYKAIQLAAKNRPEVVLMDCAMFFIGGLTTASAARA